MSAKYHIGKNGKPSLCRATKGKCPLGGESGDEMHFSSPEEAQQYLEKKFESKYGLIGSLSGIERPEENEEVSIQSLREKGLVISNKEILDKIDKLEAAEKGIIENEELGIISPSEAENMRTNIQNAMKKNIQMAKENGDVKTIKEVENELIDLSRVIAEKSKDPNTKVGACVVDSNFNVIGSGFNDMPDGENSEQFPWGKEGSFEDTKYAYVVHAELNAILNSDKPVKGGSIYVSLFPCNECAKAIVQSGIKEVVYAEEKYSGSPADIVSRRILKSAGVIVREHEKA